MYNVVQYVCTKIKKNLENLFKKKTFFCKIKLKLLCEKWQYVIENITDGEVKVDVVIQRLFYQLFSVCRPNGWSQHLSYFLKRLLHTIIRTYLKMTRFHTSYPFPSKYLGVWKEVFNRTMIWSQGVNYTFMHRSEPLCTLQIAVDF